ncbi:ankyrin repeat protein [Metarhizium album ARSEF 1941]|uniref:Ankyrin repeat protein n=1 Tax=Metarhizium album (strain ARSEF 1941) TaxID=1081103 RepID=A0A0B2X3J2_METAS|nr:ankyrin repeat protein [Metarhizium album ARSEF 1941]KHN99994.1 ankyrin repeat protein [Metarhizium album ARSEF 1941]
MFGGYSWIPETASSSHGAVHDGDLDLFLKLRNAGAVPEIGFGYLAESCQVWEYRRSKEAIGKWSQPSTLRPLLFCSGHCDVAKAIVEVVKARWSRENNDEVRYRIKQDQQGDEDGYYSDGETEGSEGEPQLESWVVGKDFTIEDVGHISMQVKSHVTPVRHLCDNVSTFGVKEGKASKTGWRYRTLFRHVVELKCHQIEITGERKDACHGGKRNVKSDFATRELAALPEEEKEEEADEKDEDTDGEQWSDTGR